MPGATRAACALAPEASAPTCPVWCTETGPTVAPRLAELLRPAVSPGGSRCAAPADDPGGPDARRLRVGLDADARWVSWDVVPEVDWPLGLERMGLTEIRAERAWLAADRAAFRSTLISPCVQATPTLTTVCQTGATCSIDSCARRGKLHGPACLYHPAVEDRLQLK